MDMIVSDVPALFDLLARRWETPASIVAAVFSKNSASVVFVGSDGKVWQTQTAETESSTRRFRVAADTGRPTISPRRKAIKPLSSSALDDEVTCVAPLHDRFALGCRSGRILTMTTSGRLSLLSKQAGQIDAISSSRQDLFIASGGFISHCQVGQSSAQAVASCTGVVAALAPQASEGMLAWIDDEGVHIWSRPGGLLDPIPAPEAVKSGPNALAWSSCNRWLGVARGGRELALLRVEDQHVAQTITIPNYPEAVSDLSWDAAGEVLATNGAFRIVAWDVGRLNAEPEVSPTTRQTGLPGYVAVSTVAFNPRKPLVAAGYESGRIIVAQVGQTSELVLREAGGGRATAMSWSEDGNHLAFGTSEGDAVVATFPPALFK